jgi:hypothetical protein
MINRQSLLSDLQKLLQKLEADLLERSMSAEVPEVGTRLKEEHERATKAQRTAQNYEDWRTDAITQAAAAWVLSCVFVRFLEDNRLIDPPKISGQQSAVSGQQDKAESQSLNADKLNADSYSRLQRARDEHELYFRKHPKQTDREYLLSIFDQLAKLPGTKDVFGEHNPIRELPNWLSGDAAGELLKFFQKIDANTGTLVHDFTDSNWDTRFLGDLYQDLSEAARKKYALLQTPEFVEEFILDRTLDPALDEFGLEPGGELSAISDQPSAGNKKLNADKLTADRYFKMIDPACGSGHFLLGSFPRILDRWMKKEPGTNVRELVQRTLHSIHGVDVNPFAIAIARFRLLLAALKACGTDRLADAPAFEMNLVCGDSLLHAPLATGGRKYTAGQRELDFALVDDPSESDECDHAYRSENLPELKRLLRGSQYHAVVANPPYITVKDRQLNDRYRRRYHSCHMKYSLSVPFLERIFRLAITDGYTGQITSNSFMKREFGKKLIETFFPAVDLTHVIDTSGAYIPGHGTPTVILFGRHRPPVASILRTVMGIRGEPSTPEDPAHGVVWSAMTAQIDQSGSQSEFVSVGDSPRSLFHKHPWSIGGGGASELQDRLNSDSQIRLGDIVDSIGFASFPAVDDAFVADRATLKRACIPGSLCKPYIAGDVIRDWMVDTYRESAFAPYENGSTLIPLCPDQKWARRLWSIRSHLNGMKVFGGKTRQELGDPWWGWYRWIAEKYRTNSAVVFAHVATHNQFVFSRSDIVFNQHAPIIKFRIASDDDLHHAVSGLLNSSTAGFWLKQVAHNKGSTVDLRGARQRTSPFEDFYEFSGTKLQEFPLPVDRPLLTARSIDILVAQARDFQPESVAYRETPTSAALETAKYMAQLSRTQMIAAQEELDWECYRLYGLISDNFTMPEPPPIKLGERAFEIVLARKMAAGESQTTWFERHGSTPITELPAEWPDDYRQLVERRIALIESDPNIRLIEQPEYKRRWNTESWELQLERALREWLLNRLEGYLDFDGRMKTEQQGSEGAGEKTSESPPLAEIALVSVARLASVAGQDADFLQVGELYRDDAAFDVQALVTELVAPECVPLLPALRYKPAGLIKRTTWERTWDLQRQEDAIDARTQLPATDPNYLPEDAAKALKEKQVGKIPVPTKYDSKDFLTSDYWRLRGKLDVPKERWISFPHCDGPDGTMMLCWAGYDHLQQARAISAYYVQVQTEFGGSDDPRLIPLLAGLIELLPWLKQWHNDLDPEFNMSMGDYFEGFINEEARQLGKTLQEIKDWVPPAKAPGRRSRKARS